jgi:uncharacterized protein YjbI with pentapeptide repeats
MNSKRFVRRMSGHIFNRLTALLAIMGILVAIIGFLFRHGLPSNLGQMMVDGIADYYVDLSAGLLILAIFEQMLRWRDEVRQKKNRLIHQLRSHNNKRALDALHEIVAHGWHQDGSLQCADLTGTNLEGADFTEADLRGAILTGARLGWANLSKANMQTANLLDADLRNAKLDDADLQGALMTGAHLDNAHMEGTKLQGAYLPEEMYKAYLSKANLAGSDLEAVDFHGAHLEGIDLSRADLRQANLQGANLLHARLEGAKFDTQVILPDGSQWTPESDLTKFTDPRHPQFWAATEIH